LFVMCRVQTCLLSLSEIRDRLAGGRLALAALRPQTGSETPDGCLSCSHANAGPGTMVTEGPHTQKAE
ncbi:hypothetical protein KUCAC02_025551, partial [Chaenocephalus aceratus]